MPPQPNRGASPLAIPGQAHVHFEHLAGPLSTPVAVNMATGNGVHAIVYGGVTARAHLAAILMQNVAWSKDEDGDLCQPTDTEFVERSLQMADMLLKADQKMTMDAVEAARAEAERVKAEKSGVSPGGIALP